MSLFWTESVDRSVGSCLKSFMSCENELQTATFNVQTYNFRWYSCTILWDTVE